MAVCLINLLPLTHRCCKVLYNFPVKKKLHTLTVLATTLSSSKANTFGLARELNLDQQTGFKGPAC